MRILRACIAFILIAAMLVTPAYATVVEDVYGLNVDSTISSFASAFGWDTNNFEAVTWTAQDGEKIVTDSVGYQDDYYEDMLDLLAEELGIIIENSGYGSGTGSGIGIVAVALAEAAAEDNAEVPLGSNNCKYNTWYYGSEVSGDAYPWCAVFVAWCADQCGYLDSGLFPRVAHCDGFYNHFVSECGFAAYSNSEIAQLGGGGYSAVPGDIFLFANGGEFSFGRFGHIGIVTAVGDGYINVTQGNTSDMVVTLQYGPESLGNYSIGNGVIVHVEYPDSGGSVFNYLVSGLGISPAAACGIMANFSAESGLCPARVQGDFSEGFAYSYSYADQVDSGAISREEFVYNGPGGGGFGLAQWTFPSRKAGLYDLHVQTGLSIASVELQLSYLQSELMTGDYYTNVYVPLMSLGNTVEDARQAAYIWCVEFESPADKYTMAELRADSAANEFYPQYVGG